MDEDKDTIDVAMAEIMDICKKHDLISHVCLLSQEHSASRYNFEPKWACVRGNGQDVELLISKATNLKMIFCIFREIRDLNIQSVLSMETAMRKITEAVLVMHSQNYEDDDDNDDSKETVH